MLSRGDSLSTGRVCQANGGLALVAAALIWALSASTASAQMRITEFMHGPNTDEFMEFTNIGAMPISMVGWSFDDSGRTPGFYSLSGFGTVQPGESVILAGQGIQAATFRSRWNLSNSVKVLDGSSHGLSGGGDEVNLYDNNNQLVDRITYSSTPISALNKSAWPCGQAIGLNDYNNWRLSGLGDIQMSNVNTDTANPSTANPGRFVLQNCVPGRCCINGVCSVMLDVECAAQHGLFGGAGSNCTANPCPAPSNANVRFTEFMFEGTDNAYGGNDGEFVEITNLGGSAVNLNNWSFDDSTDIPGSVFLTAAGTLNPGESLVITESDADVFRAAWGLAPTVKVIGNTPGTAHIKRADVINLYDSSGTRLDRLTYDDELPAYYGMPVAYRRGAWPCAAAVGVDQALNWRQASMGDAQNSIASTFGDIGSPGAYTSFVCPATPTGSCCSNGFCTTVTQHDCLVGLGVYKGDGTNCTANPCPSASTALVRFTEYMYDGLGSTVGGFVEITNLDTVPVSLNGWSYDDGTNRPGIISLSAVGTLAPGQSIVLTEGPAATFITEWGLSGVTVIGDIDFDAAIGREDRLNLYDASGSLVDALDYGDQTFLPGSIQTENIAGWACDNVVGVNNIRGWVLSSPGDPQTSVLSAASNLGSPGRHTAFSCAGACCNMGNCSNGFLSDCRGANGLFKGYGTTCGAGTCPVNNRRVGFTEYMYTGLDGEFVEITNLDTVPVSLAGWSFDDSTGLVGSIDLTPLGTLAPGEAAVLTDATAADFRTAWGLAPTVKVLGGIGGNAGLGRDDTLNLWDASGTLVQTLQYGDSAFIPGSIRTQDVSGWVCDYAVGVNDILLWRLSTLGDSQGSHLSAQGNLGSPGVHLPTANGDMNASGSTNGRDIGPFVTAVLNNSTNPNDLCAGDFNGDGTMTAVDVSGMVNRLLN